MADVEMYKAKGRKKGKSIYMADVLVPRIAGVQAYLSTVAEFGAARAAARLAAHTDTGNSSIHVSRGKVDRYVWLTDPMQVDGNNRRWGGLAALAVEAETGALTSTFGLPPVAKPRGGG